MAPGRKRDLRKEKKKNTNFCVGNKSRAGESVKSSSTKKAKDKHNNKKKVSLSGIFKDVFRNVQQV